MQSLLSTITIPTTKDILLLAEESGWVYTTIANHWRSCQGIQTSISDLVPMCDRGVLNAGAIENVIRGYFHAMSLYQHQIHKDPNSRPPKESRTHGSVHYTKDYIDIQSKTLILTNGPKFCPLVVDWESNRIPTCAVLTFRSGQYVLAVQYIYSKVATAIA